jgi:hypothetical protein
LLELLKVGNRHGLPDATDAEIENILKDPNASKEHKANAIAEKKIRSRNPQEKTQHLVEETE